MRYITGVVGIATVVAAMLAATSSFASYPSSFGPAPFPSTFERESSLLAKELAVLTDQGIAPARASESLRLQGEVVRARLMRKISAALGDSYAGAWFDPPAAKFDVGVTSGASARRVRRVAADAGLGASVVETPVRHTWAELIAAQARWHARLSKLLAQGEAQTGLDSPHNAVVVTLSSSVPAAERAALRREAVTDNSANVSVDVSTPAQMGVKKDAVTCTSPFVTEEGYCQPTLVSGVAIRTPEGLCTSGPMLFEGNETYMVTAGHCFGKGSPEGGSAVTGEVTSRYTPTGALLEIGETGTWYENNERDMAIVRVNRAANNFTQPLPSPVPVPALMAEWEKEPLNPHAVNGVREAAPKLVVCHEGAVTGEKCGEILKLNVEAAGTAHLVEVNACAQTGDSGGPFFRRETGEVMMMGIEVASNQCVEPFKSYFEPMLDLEGSPEKGVLSTFHPKELLTKSNETRTTPTLSAKWLVGGAEVATELSAELEGEFTLVDLKTLLGVAEILCASIFTGALLAGGEALINEMLNLAGVAISLTALSGTALSCTDVKNCTEPLVWAVHLPWTELLELEIIEESTNEPYAVLIKSGGAGNPGLYVECMGSLSFDDECTASELIAEAKNGETAAELVFAEKLREDVFMKLASCTQGGAEAGHLVTGSGDANELVTSTGGVVTVSS